MRVDPDDAERHDCPGPPTFAADRLPVESDLAGVGRAHLCVCGIAGRNARQTRGLPVARAMKDAGIAQLGFVASDQTMPIRGLDPVPDPAAFVASDTPRDGGED